jgi:hypothetical protein
MNAILRIMRFSSMNIGLLALLLTGCGVVGSAPTTTPGPITVVPPATAPAATPLPPTETPSAATPTLPVQAELLPAPVYFIASADGQLWRVERDGVTLTQITRGEAPVVYYDVSPADGGLVYISANSLILSAGDGSGQQAVFSGPQDYPEDQAINNELTWPRFSPDGRRIAFGYGGIQILDLDSPMLTPNVLLPSDPLPDPNAGRPPTELRFYRQAIWSLDSTRLLVEFNYYPEGGGWSVLLLNADGEGALVDLQPAPAGGLLCCEPTWSLDSQSIYFATQYIGMVTPGLHRANAASGEVETLIGATGEPGNETYSMVEQAEQLADGQLYYFLGTVQGFPTGSFTPLTMYRADAGAGNGTALRTDTHTLEEVLWAPDASGAVIMQVGEGSVFPYHGPLAWLPADGTAAVELPADGTSLVWGK